MRIASTMLFALSFMLFSCESVTNSSETPDEKPEAAQIIQQAIEAHGSKMLEGKIIDFDFRNRHYRASGVGGKYTYERIFKDTTGTQYRDVLINDDFYREVNGEKQTISAKDSAAYANSVNSVIYFAFLPYFLNDQAVQATYLGEVTIKDEAYHKVKVTFRQEGGGKDFEDEYIYWIHQDRYTMDYLAYNYQVDGGGARFREAYNVRTVDGIRFADYVNYKPVPKTLEVNTFDSLFVNGQLEELSRIDTENVAVSPIENDEK